MKRRLPTRLKKPSDIRPIAPGRARTRTLSSLTRMVLRDQFARPIDAGASMRQFLDSLPEVLAAAQLRDLAVRIARARRAGKPVLLMSGAHAIKVGLGPIITSLMRDGVITALATNGAAIIHDFELAFAGRTSEDVGAGLADDSFGMVYSRRRGVSVSRPRSTSRLAPISFICIRPPTAPRSAPPRWRISIA